MRRDLLWYGLWREQPLTVETVCDALEQCAQCFRDLPPRSGSTAIYKAIILVFPPGLAPDVNEVITEAQRRCSPAFISNGLMLGQFYPGCTDRGIRNPGFRPLDSPVPLLAMRYMVPQDAFFLLGNTRLLLRYFAHVGLAGLTPTLEALRERLKRRLPARG